MRRILQNSIRGSTISSANFVWPVHFARASTLRNGLPTTLSGDEFCLLLTEVFHLRLTELDHFSPSASNQASHSFMTSTLFNLSVYRRVRPCFLAEIKPAASSTRRCLVVVGQAWPNRPSISPAVMLPPRNFIVNSICRRAGCASALQTASSAARRSSGLGLGTNRFELGKLQALQVRSHRFPNGHDFGRLMGDA